MSNHGITMKFKQPHAHIEAAIAGGQGRTRALVKKLSDQAILELADVLSEFTEGAREREDERLAKAKKAIEYLRILRTEFGDAEEALHRIVDLGYLERPFGFRRFGKK